MLVKLKRCSYFFTAFLLGYFIYEISIIMLKIGFNDASKNIFYVILGVYLSMPMIRYAKLKKENIFEEVELCAKMGENFKALDLDITRLQGITLKIDGEEETIDDLVISSKGVFNIVECKLTGQINIEDTNKWLRKTMFNKTESLVLSPVNKIRKNRELLKKIYSEDEIIDLIVMTNDWVDILNEDECCVPIVRHDEMVEYISEYESDDMYNSEELYDKMSPFIVKEKNLDNIFNCYNKILDNRWQVRSRLAAVTFFFVLYIFNMISLGI